MYKLIEKDKVLTELNSGSEMYAVDIPTQRVMDCSTLTLSAVKSFIDNPATMFFKAVANE